MSWQLEDFLREPPRRVAPPPPEKRDRRDIPAWFYALGAALLFVGMFAVAVTA